MRYLLKIVFFFIVLLPIICLIGGLYHASRGADKAWEKFWEFFNNTKRL